MWHRWCPAISRTRRTHHFLIRSRGAKFKLVSMPTPLQTIIIESPPSRGWTNHCSTSVLIYEPVTTTTAITIIIIIIMWFVYTNCVSYWARLPRADFHILQHFPTITPLITTLAKKKMENVRLSIKYYKGIRYIIAAQTYFYAIDIYWEQCKHTMTFVMALCYL